MLACNARLRATDLRPAPPVQLLIGCRPVAEAACAQMDLQFPAAARRCHRLPATSVSAACSGLLTCAARLPPPAVYDVLSHGG